MTFPFLFQAEAIEEFLDYTALDLLSAFGGFIGMFIGAIIMFFVLGFFPGYIIARVLHGMGKLRIPREVELAGLDYQILEDASSDEKAVASSSR